MLQCVTTELSEQIVVSFAIVAMIRVITRTGPVRMAGVRMGGQPVLAANVSEFGNIQIYIKFSK